MAREKLKSRRPWYIAVAVAVMIVIAIIVPLATILPKKHHHPKKTNVLFPLYIWPKTNTTWDPLYAE